MQTAVILHDAFPGAEACRHESNAVIDAVQILTDPAHAVPKAALIVIHRMKTVRTCLILTICARGIWSSCVLQFGACSCFGTISLWECSFHRRPLCSPTTHGAACAQLLPSSATGFRATWRVVTWLPRLACLLMKQDCFPSISRNISRDGCYWCRHDCE